jgi:hypothetical protein
MMCQTGNRSLEMVRRYIREGSLFRETRRRGWAYKRDLRLHRRARELRNRAIRPGANRFCCRHRGWRRPGERERTFLYQCLWIPIPTTARVISVVVIAGIVIPVPVIIVSIIMGPVSRISIVSLADHQCPLYSEGDQTFRWDSNPPSSGLTGRSGAGTYGGAPSAAPFAPPAIAPMMLPRTAPPPTYLLVCLFVPTPSFLESSAAIVSGDVLTVYPHLPRSFRPLR